MTDEKSNPRRKTVKAINIYTGSEEKTFDTDAIKKNRVTISNLEKEIIFTSPGLKLLEAFLLSADDLQKNMTRLSSSKASDSYSIINAKFFSTNFAVTCEVNCVRLMTLFSIYTCDGGWAEGCSCSQGEGIFLITGCPTFSYCKLDCSSFNQVE